MGRADNILTVHFPPLYPGTHCYPPAPAPVKRRTLKSPPSRQKDCQTHKETRTRGKSQVSQERHDSWRARRLAPRPASIFYLAEWGNSIATREQDGEFLCFGRRRWWWGLCLLIRPGPNPGGSGADRLLDWIKRHGVPEGRVG